MNDKQYALLKVYSHVRETALERLLDIHTAGPDFNDWKTSKADVATVVTNVNRQLAEYGFIEEVPDAANTTYKITPTGDYALTAHQADHAEKAGLNTKTIRNNRKKNARTTIIFLFWVAVIVLLQCVHVYGNHNPPGYSQRRQTTGLSAGFVITSAIVVAIIMAINHGLNVLLHRWIKDELV